MISGGVEVHLFSLNIRGEIRDRSVKTEPNTIITWNLARPMLVKQIWRFQKKIW